MGWLQPQPQLQLSVRKLEFFLRPNGFEPVSAGSAEARRPADLVLAVGLLGHHLAGETATAHGSPARRAGRRSAAAWC